MIYYILIGDMIDSKKINYEQRRKIQSSLKECLDRINIKYSEYLVTEMTITLGDEFQGMFRNIDKIFEIITIINVSFNVYFRYGIGIGQNYTDLNNKISIGMDGPAWWEARNNIEEIRNKHEKGINNKTSMIITGLKDKTIIELINSILSFCSYIYVKWTEPEKMIILKIVEQIGLISSFNQRELAKKNEIDPTYLNKKLKSSRFLDYCDSLNAVNDAINYNIAKEQMYE